MTIAEIKVAGKVRRSKGLNKFLFIMSDVVSLAVWLTVGPITHKKHESGRRDITYFVAIAIHNIVLIKGFWIKCNDRVLPCVTAVEHFD